MQKYYKLFEKSSGKAIFGVDYDCIKNEFAEHLLIIRVKPG